VIFLFFLVLRWEEKDVDNKKEFARLHERYTDVGLLVAVFYL